MFVSMFVYFHVSMFILIHFNFNVGGHGSTRVLTAVFVVILFLRISERHEELVCAQESGKHNPYAVMFS